MVTEKMIEALGAETTVDDHLRNLIQLMKRGGRVSVTDIPNDPTFLSSNFGGPTVQAMAEKLEAALSTDAEPVGYLKEAHADVIEPRYIDAKERVQDWQRSVFTVPLYAAPPAPSVAVKALRWDGGDARSPTGTYRVQRLDDKWEPLHNGYYMLPKMGGVVKAFGTEDEAKARCQQHHDKAIRSALSAQVQDVAGLSVWEGWDKSRDFWSETKHRDEVMYAMFRGPWSMEDAATLLGFIDRTWPKAPAAKLEEKP